MTVSKVKDSIKYMYVTF